MSSFLTRGEARSDAFVRQVAKALGMSAEEVWTMFRRLGMTDGDFDETVKRVLLAEAIRKASLN